MKIMNGKFLAAGLLAGALTFAGCSSPRSAERTDQGEAADGTSTGTQTAPGTGGSGISKTKQSDDNLRMPREDPLRTPESESVRDAEAEPGVHDNDPGTGGSGFSNEAPDDASQDILNEGGNVDDTTRIPDSPADTTPEDLSQIPEGAR
jgi:hypothetical protein